MRSRSTPCATWAPDVRVNTRLWSGPSQLMHTTMLPLRAPRSDRSSDAASAAGAARPTSLSPAGRAAAWSPRGIPGWLTRVLICVALTQSALNLVRPTTSYRALALGADERVIGLLTAAYAVVPVLVALPLGRVADRRSPAPLFVAGTVALAAGCGLLGLASSLWGLALASAVLGFGHLAFMVGGQTLLGVQSPPELQDRDYGLYTAVTSLGQLLGPALAGLLLGSSSGLPPADATTTVFLLGLGLAALALPFTWRVRVGPTQDRAPVTAASTGAARLLRLPGLPAGLFASLALLAAVDLVTAYLPVLAEQAGVGPAAVGLLLSLRALGSIASRLLLRGLVLRWGRARLMLGSTLGSALLLAALPFFGSAPAWAVLLVVSGFLLGVGQPLTMVVVVRAAPAGAQGMAVAMRLTGNRIGQVAVPVAAGLAAGAAGAGAAFWLLGGLLGLAALALGVGPAGTAGGQPDRQA